MSRTWEEDKAWSDRYLPTVKAICGYYFIGEAPREEDLERNTDLIVLNIQGVRIAVRIRHLYYWMQQKQGLKYPRWRYRGEFTIRTDRPQGTITEWQKILSNFGDYFFYGFADDDHPPKLRGFGILDLQHFRTWVKEYHDRTKQWPGVRVPNPDGTWFRAIQWADVPASAVLTTWPKDVADGIALMPEDLRRGIQVAMEYT